MCVCVTAVVRLDNCRKTGQSRSKKEGGRENVKMKDGRWRMINEVVHAHGSSKECVVE